MVGVDPDEYARFRAYQAREAERERERIAQLWVRWAREVGGDPQGIVRAYKMATMLMAAHGVEAWTLRIGNARRQDGSVTYKFHPGTRVWDGKPGILTLSGPLMSLWTESQQRETILHEIAHIKAPDHGHDAYWGYRCAQLGIQPRRCWSDDKVDSAPPVRSRAPRTRLWVGTCPGGHAHRPRTRKPTTRYSCSQCSPGRFDEDALITWARTGES